MDSGKVEAPFWSYKLGLDNGWIPNDPREVLGACSKLGITPTTPWDGKIPPTATGGAGAGNIAPGVEAGYPWPPPAFADEGDASSLPTYTPTGPISTLPAPTFTNSKGQPIDAGNGWFNPNDSPDGMYVPVAGCKYPDPWDSVGVAVPPPCPAAR